MKTYGNFMRMKTQVTRKETMIMAKPIDIKNTLLKLGGLVVVCVLSKMMKPHAPTVNKRLAASPSIMYWPLTR